VPNVSATYPAALISFGVDVVDFSDTVLANHVNTLRAEVAAIEATVGVSPKLSSGWVGEFTQPSISYTWNTVKDRLNNIEYGISAVYAAIIPTGGTANQVLVKNSSTDYDFSWTAAPAGETFNPLLLIGA
jgi:hypothetical protein